MGTLPHHRRRLSAAAAVALLFFATALGGGGGLMTGIAQLESEKETHSLHGAELHGDHRPVPVRRRLIGPGSSPPTCRARCGRCAPCRPVHVVIQPGRSVPMEYFPEAWRCKCGNKLFMP